MSLVIVTHVIVTFAVVLHVVVLTEVFFLVVRIVVVGGMMFLMVAAVMSSFMSIPPHSRCDISNYFIGYLGLLVGHWVAVDGRSFLQTGLVFSVVMGFVGFFGFFVVRFFVVGCCPLVVGFG